MRKLDYRVMNKAFECHNALGRMCDEVIYQNELTERLTEVDLVVDSEVPIHLTFGCYAKTLYIDTVIERSIPYELKAVKELAIEHEEQLLLYMLLVNARRGKLINFRPDSVKSKYVNASLTTIDRHQYSVDTNFWDGAHGFRELVEALIADWGTSLSVGLYTEAITENLGGQELVVRQVPMHLNGHAIGAQRFHLVEPATAFKISTFNAPDLTSHRKQFRKLINPSSLVSLYWVNIARHRLRFECIHR